MSELKNPIKQRLYDSRDRLGRSLVDDLREPMKTWLRGTNVLDNPHNNLLYDPLRDSFKRSCIISLEESLKEDDD